MPESRQVNRGRSATDVKGAWLDDALAGGASVVDPRWGKAHVHGRREASLNVFADSELTGPNEVKTFDNQRKQRKLATWGSHRSVPYGFKRLLRLITHQNGWLKRRGFTLSSKGAHNPRVDGVNKTMRTGQTGCWAANPQGWITLRPLPGPWPPDGFTSLKAMANCDHWVSRVAGSYCSAGHAWWRWSRYGESDFHTLSLWASGLSAVSTTRSARWKLQLTDCGENPGTPGDWRRPVQLLRQPYIIRLLMKLYAAGFSDARFMTLLWKKHQGGDIYRCRSLSGGQCRCATGRVISPLLSNSCWMSSINTCMSATWVGGKARKDRWYWNKKGKQTVSNGAEVRRSEKTGSGKPAVAYCRYADDFVLIVKGTKAQAEQPSGRSVGCARRTVWNSGLNIG